MLVKTLFIYGDAVMCDTDAESENSMQVAINACVRFAYGMKRRDHISTQEKEILGCTYPNFRKYKRCLLLRNILISKQPDYLYELMSVTNYDRNPSLVIPRSVRAILRDSYFVHAISLWNSLPLEVKRGMLSATFACRCLMYFSELE